MWVVLISRIRIVCSLGVLVLLGCFLCEEWLLAFSTHLSLQNHLDSAISFSTWCMWAITFLLLHGPVAVQVALVCRITMVCLASRPSLYQLTVPYDHSTKHIDAWRCGCWDDIRLLDVDVVCLVVLLLESHVIGIWVLLKFIVTCTLDDIRNLPLPQLQVL